MRNRPQVNRGRQDKPDAVLSKAHPELWDVLAGWDYERNLEFVIDQLEESDKDYEIETGMNGRSYAMIRIWTEWPPSTERLMRKA